jgi:hypothetical protein
MKRAKIRRLPRTPASILLSFPDDRGCFPDPPELGERGCVPPPPLPDTDGCYPPAPRLPGSRLPGSRRRGRLLP